MFMFCEIPKKPLWDRELATFFSFLMKYENFIKFHAYFMPISGLKFRLWDGICGGLGAVREHQPGPDYEAGAEGRDGRDGEELGRATVRVTTLGAEFLRGGVRENVWWRTFHTSDRR